MTARQPRRTRRRNVPGATLPRVNIADEAAASAETGTRVGQGRREHHVMTDYGYVHRDLLTVAAVGAVVIAFIVAMSYVI